MIHIQETGKDQYSNGLGSGRTGVNSQQGQKVFPYPQSPDRLRDLPSLLSNEYLELFHTGVKRSRREPDHSTSCSAEVKNAPICLHGIVLN
jgi:hypothetical protein